MERGDNKSKRICTSAKAATISTHSSSPTSGSGRSSTATIQELNPLKYPLILETIFGHCSTRQLSWCRLVCSDWADASLPIWRARAALTVFQYGYNSVCVGNPGVSNRHIPLEHFLWHAQRNNFQLQRKPFQHLIFGKINFEFARDAYRDMYSTDWIKALWNDVGVGKALTTLELRDCRFNKISDYRRAIYGNFPNLKYLIISCDYILLESGLRLGAEPAATQSQYTPPTYGERPNLRSLSVKVGTFGMKAVISWLELLSHFPQLDVLNISGGCIKSQGLIDLLSAIRIIREHDGSKLPLQMLDVQAVTSVTHFRNGLNEHLQIICNLLQQLQLSLNSLNLKFDHIHQVTKVDLSELLDVNKRTLQRIRLFDDREYVRLMFPLGIRLGNLMELEMTEGMCLNMKFLKLTPNLRKLRILKRSRTFDHSLMDAHAAMITSSRKYHVKLDKLTLLKLELEFPMASKDVLRLTKWMPNVATLSMHFDDRQFGIVCKHWGNLRKLEDLGLEYFRSASRNLTNASVHNGFLKMPTLKHICFDFSLHALEFGDDARNALLLNGVRLSAASEFCSECTAKKL